MGNLRSMCFFVVLSSAILESFYVPFKSVSALISSVQLYPSINTFWLSDFNACMMHLCQMQNNSFVKDIVFCKTANNVNNVLQYESRNRF